VRKRLSGSLSAKLLAGQLLVVLTGALTLLLVALLVGPAIFRMHVRDALGYVPPDVGHHLDMAFHTATLISLGVAVGVSVAVALALSTIVSTRIVRPVRELAGAAQRIAHGARDARVPARGTDELAELAAAFNEMAASLERAEQIRSQLLADVAHELRTPLATVESYVEALADGVLAADDENWGVIRAETSRLNRLVDDLQKVSRAQAHQLDLHLSAVPAGTLVSDAVKAVQPAYAAKGVGLKAHIEPRVPAIEADSERIAEVLANLLTNALRHTPTGGSVSVSALQRAEQLEISVADDGEGIAPEHVDRVFERFYRVDPARSRETDGTGIGLAIVRAIVEAHGGTVTATSSGTGSGTTVTLLLPIDYPDGSPAVDARRPN
jgi:two-component system, OmpR family, sensor histidine kinase BaeS